MNDQSGTAAAVNLEDGNTWVIEGFLEVVTQALTEPGNQQELRARVLTDAQGLEQKYAPWSVDPRAQSNLRLSAVVLATYRLLADRLPGAELLALLYRAFNEPLRDQIRAGVGQYLDQVPNAFAALTDMSKDREASYFGQSFSFERPRDDRRAYYLDVTHCLWHSFFVAEGAPELTPIFCAFDENWIEGIDPERHGVRFSRPTTLGLGGPLCAFHFYQLEQEKV